MLANGGVEVERDHVEHRTREDPPDLILVVSGQPRLRAHLTEQREPTFDVAARDPAVCLCNDAEQHRPARSGLAGENQRITDEPTRGGVVAEADLDLCVVGGVDALLVATTEPLVQPSRFDVVRVCGAVLVGRTVGVAE